MPLEKNHMNDTANPTPDDATLTALDLLCSAYAIASRQGRETNWPVFQARVAECLAALGLSGATPRTFRIHGKPDGDTPSKN